MLSLKGITQVFSRSRSNDGREAKELLETVDDLLTQSNKLLNSISRRLPSNQFETFEYKYTELNLMAIEVKDDVRDREQKRIFFESEEEKQAFQSDIRKLLQQCETYRNDVVTASRRVQGGVASIPTAGESVIDASTATTESCSEARASSPSPWLSIVADAATKDDQSESAVGSGSVESSQSFSASVPAPSKLTVLELAQRFIATVACNRTDLVPGEVATTSQDDNAYFRILICANKSKRAVVLDTNPHYPDQESTDTTVSSQDNLLRVGDMLMKSDPEKLEEHQVVDSYRGPSFIASFISTFTYTSSNLLTGGML